MSTTVFAHTTFISVPYKLSITSKTQTQLALMSRTETRNGSKIFPTLPERSKKTIFTFKWSQRSTSSRIPSKPSTNDVRSILNTTPTVRTGFRNTTTFADTEIAWSAMFTVP